MAKNKVINTVLRLRDNMSGGLLKVARNTNGVSKEMMKSTRTIVAWKNRMVRSVSDVAKSFGKLTIAATGAAGAAAGAFAVKTGFSEAFGLEGFRLQLETATKSTVRAGEIMREAITLANKTPFEGGELVEGAAKFEAMGMSASKWMRRAGDMAAATNKSYDQAVEALIDAQAGELERLKEFGITKARILEKGGAMFRGIQLVNNKGEIVEQEKFNEAMIALMEDRFAGGMEKQAGTMKGVWSTITGITKSGLAQLAGINPDGLVRTGSAFDRLKQKGNELSARLMQWQQDGTIDSLAAKLDKGLAAASDKAIAAFQWMKQNLSPVAKELKATGEQAFSWAKENVLPKVEAILPKIAEGLQWIAQNMDKIGPAAMTLLKIWAGNKLLKFGLDAVKTANDFKLFGKTLIEIGKKTFGGKLFGGAKKLGGKLFSGIGASAKGFLDALKKVGGMGKNALGRLAKIGSRSITVLFNGIHQFADKGVRLLTKGIELAISGFVKFGTCIRDFAGKGVGLLKKGADIAKVGIGKLGGGIMGLLGKLATFGKAAVAFVAANPIVIAIAAAIAAGVLIWKNWDKIKTYAGQLWTKIKETFGGIKDSIVGAFDAAKEKVSGFFSWLDNKIESIPLLGSLYKGGKQLVGGAMNWIGSAFGRNALGTSYWRGGLTRVHERGGEIMNLPSGTQIIPHDVSMRMAGGPQVSVQVVVQGNVIGNRQFADEMGETIWERIRKALDNT